MSDPSSVETAKDCFLARFFFPPRWFLFFFDIACGRVASGRRVAFELFASPPGVCRAVGPGRWFSAFEFAGVEGAEIRGGAGVDIVRIRQLQTTETESVASSSQKYNFSTS
jgi:hypothetical protein